MTCRSGSPRTWSSSSDGKSERMCSKARVAALKGVGN